MASAPKSVRDTAAKASDALKTGAAAAAVSVASTMLTAPGSPVAGPIGLLGALMQAAGMVVERWANDPPRPDYERRTRVVTRSLSVELVPDAPVVREARVAALALASAEATLAAALRAFERELGAAQKGEAELLAARRDERLRYSGMAARDLREANTALAAFADALERETAADSATATVPSAVAGLPESLLAWLYRVGIPISNTRRLVKLTAERGGALLAPRRRAAAIRAVGPSLVVLAHALDEWRGGDADLGTYEPSQQPLF